MVWVHSASGEDVKYGGWVCEYVRYVGPFHWLLWEVGLQRWLFVQPGDAVTTAEKKARRGVTVRRLPFR